MSMFKIHLFLVIISALSIAAWLLALITQALVTVKYGNAFVRFLWFSIFLQLYVNLRTIKTVILLGRTRKRKRQSFDSEKEEALLYRREIVVFGGISVVFGVIGVDMGIFSGVPSRVALACAWLIMVITDLVWIWLLTAEIGSVHLQRSQMRDLERDVFPASSSSSQERKSTPSLPTSYLHPEDANAEEIDAQGDDEHNSPTAVSHHEEELPSPRSSKRTSRTPSTRNSRKLDEEEPLQPGRTASTTITTSDSDQKVYKIPGSSSASSPKSLSPVPTSPTEVPTPKPGRSRTVFTPFSPYLPTTQSMLSPPKLDQYSPPKSGIRPAASISVTGSSAAPSSVVDYSHRAKTLYHYTASPEISAEDSDYVELSFRKGEMLEVFREPERKWWRARKQNGQVGIVPSNYLQIIRD